jgi:hypothetical protein
MSQKHEQAIAVLEVGELFKKLRGREDLNAKSSWKMAQIACNDNVLRIDELQLTTYQRLNNPARRAASLKQTRYQDIGIND